jgi:hypothetical protein
MVDMPLPGVGGEYFSDSGGGSGGDEPLHHVDDPVVGVNIRCAHGYPVHCQQPILQGVRQGVTKRCRLSLLTNSALVIRVQMQGDVGGLPVAACGVSAVDIT